MESIKVSVIIPVYKVEQYLHQCVDSILGQTYQNIEVILVDDGSPDRCPELCDAYARQDKRVIVVHKQNGGLSDARNTGLRNATGDYVAFVDSDDYWKDETVLKKLIKRVELTKADVLNYLYEKSYEDSTKNQIFGGSSKSMPLDRKEKKSQLDYLFNNSLYIAAAWNKLIKRSVLLKAKGFRVGMLSEDIDWCARLLYYAKTFDYLNLLVYSYRQREGSITHTMKAKACTDLEKAILLCFQILKRADQDTVEGLRRYIAYQFATFIAVQSIAESCPAECYDRLSNYSWILQYHGNQRKVRMLHIGCSLLGFRGLCKLVRQTKSLWGK